MKLKNLLGVVATVVLGAMLFSSCKGGGQTTPPQPTNADKMSRVGSTAMDELILYDVAAGTTTGQASRISNEKLAAKGKFITGVRFYCPVKIGAGEVFVTTDIAEDPIAVKEITDNVLGSWRVILFSEPVEIKTDDLFVGYKVSVAKAGATAVVLRNKTVANDSEYVYSRGWKQMKKTFNQNYSWFATVEAIVVDGNYDSETQNDLSTFDGYAPFVSTGNSTISASCEVMNNGIFAVNNVKVACMIDGKEAAAATVPGTILPGQSVFVDIANAQVPSGAGSHTIEFVPSSSANDDIAGNNSKVSTVVYPTEGTPRNAVLFEQFTGQDCPNCPGGTSALEEAIAGLPAADQSKVVWVAHHAGYYPDDFTIPGSVTIANKFQINAAPSLVINRTLNNWTPNSPAGFNTHPGYATTQLVRDAINTPAFATLNMTRTYNEATRELTVTISGKFLTHDTHRATVIITEDGLVGRQSSGGNNYVHNGVPCVFVTNAEGDALTRNSDDTFEKTFTVTIPESVTSTAGTGKTFACDVENMNVVAILHGTVDVTAEAICANAAILPILEQTSNLPGYLRFQNAEPNFEEQVLDPMMSRIVRFK